MKKLIILLFALTVGLTSCSKFTDLEPFDYISDEAAMSTYENAKASLTGAYDGLQHAAYYGRNFVVMGDAPTDNVMISPDNSNRFLAEAQWSITAANADIADLWNYTYSRIRRVNNIINNVDNIPDATDAQKNQMKGEALTLRALIHFDLVRIFAQTYDYTTDGSHLGVPYVTEISETPRNFQPARDNVKTVYDNIVKDLDDAIAALNGGTAPYYITQLAAKALKARVALTMADYPTAKALAKEVISSGSFTLVANANYAASWGLEKTTESIFTIPYANTDYSATNALGYIYVQAGYGDLRVPSQLKALFNAGDARQCFFKAGTGTKADFTFVNKYPSRDNVTGLDNYNVIRLSEIYLIAAEACAKTSEEGNARTYLNAIRQRALPTAAAATETGTALEDAIFLEKRKELCYEGHYYFDLKRLHKTINSAYDSKGDLYEVLTYPSNLLAYPIPQREIDANPNMVQNPD